MSVSVATAGTIFSIPAGYLPPVTVTIRSCSSIAGVSGATHITIAVLRDSVGMNRPADGATSALRPPPSARPEMSARGDVERNRDGVHPWRAAGRPWPDAARGTQRDTLAVASTDGVVDVVTSSSVL